MKTNAVEQLVERWLNEPGFSTKLTNDPVETVASCGVTLTAEEWSTLRNVVLGTSNERLGKRMSKGGGGQPN